MRGFEVGLMGKHCWQFFTVYGTENATVQITQYVLFLHEAYIMKAWWGGRVPIFNISNYIISMNDGNGVYTKLAVKLSL